jgi:hypothetical protein
MMKPTNNRFIIIALLTTLTLCSSTLSGVSAQQDPVPEDGVSNFLDRLEGAVAEKTLWFYRHFGQNLNRNKIITSAENSCDYDDPAKIKFCPPVPVPPHLAKQSAAAKRTSAKKEATSAAKEEELYAGISPLALTKCLDDPTDPDCVRLLQDDEEDEPDAAGSVAPRSTNYVTSMPTGTSEGLATQEPTRDDCYGNMLDGRFCTSEMPSISEEPTVVPEPSADIPMGETAFTTADSSAMTFNDGSEVKTCMIDVHNVDNSPDASFGMPLSLVSSKGQTVTFEINQSWKQDSTVEFIHTVFITPPTGETRECDRLEQVPFGAQPKQ